MISAADTIRQTSRELKSAARGIGFDLVGVAPAVTPNGFHAFLDWLGRGYDGEMGYLARRRDAYEHPDGVLDGVRSVVMLAVNYRSADPPRVSANTGRVSRYAWGEVDYHDMLRDKLQRLGDVLHEQHPGCRTRGIVDTAPLLERDFARLAGLGWFGKNTMLLNKRAGSWLFLAALLTDVELEPDEPHETNHCGTCTRCLDACPTDAFPEPYVLDARRCISYLTIELRSPIPAELRAGVGEWLFGCDVCQDVCPWNRKAPRTADPAFGPRAELYPAEAIEFLGLTEQAFQDRYGSTALARPGRTGMARNAAIVLGNCGDERAVPALVAALDGEDAIVRGAAAWALGRIGGDEAKLALERRLVQEIDETVKNELVAALDGVSSAG
ncbi:MAG: tRNA epoxyqueuosine(34) reductase QueG [Planctomycetes bacterium]|nr:tRNA epoxyqueuosine(34) reductase QueG [Planctomycetota bacterium]